MLSTQVGSALCSAFVTCLLAFAPLPARAQAKPKIPPVPRIEKITVDRFQDLFMEPETNHFSSPGPVRIILVDADTHEQTVLLADDAEGQLDGDIVIKGHLRLERPEGVLTGRALTYHVPTRTGELLDAESRAANVVLRGAKIDMFVDAKGRQIIRATHAYFTTCIRRTPHYHITAREIRIIGGQSAVAKNVGFYLGNFRLITLPSMTKNFQTGTESPLPLPGYSREDYVHLRYRQSLLAEPANLFNIDLTVSARRTPSGSMTYEHDLAEPTADAPPPNTRRYTATEPQRTALESTPPLLRGALPEADQRRDVFYAMLTSDTFVYNRLRTDIQLSRLPEVGISLRNLLNRPSPITEPNAPYPRAESAFGSGFLSPAKWFVNAEAGLGYYQEMPSHTQAVRFGTRADGTSPLFIVSGPLYARYGITGWGNLYSNHNAYGLVAPEAELDYLLRHDTLLGFAYRYQQDFGKTPFLFDRRDVRHEIRLRYGYLGPAWAYDMELKYDVERKHAYDNVFSVRRRLDCLEFGFAYHTRDQGFSLLFNLLPGSIRKAPVSAPAQ